MALSDKFSFFKTHKYLTLVIKVTGVFLLLLTLLFFILRNYLLDYAIEKIALKLKTKFELELKVEKASFSGLSSINLKGISIKEPSGDSLFFLANLEAGLRLKFLLLGDVRLKEIIASNGYLSLVKTENKCNYSFLSINKKEQPEDDGLDNKTEASSNKSDYAAKLYGLINKLLNHIPDKIVVSNFNLDKTENEINLKVVVNNLSLIKSGLSASLKVKSGANEQIWQIDGYADASKQKANLHFFSTDTSKLILPYLEDKYNLKAGFNQLTLQIDELDYRKKELKINGIATINNFLLNHPKISKQDVEMQQIEFKYSYLFGENFISLESTSNVKINNFEFRPFFYFENSPDTIYKLSFLTPKTNAMDFINSLPAGLFSHIKGIEAEGAFTYSLNFVFNVNKPDEMIFESSFKKENLKVLKFGEANLSKLNTEFVYTPIENGRPQRSIFIGLANPNYTSLDQIPEHLKNSILTTEDPSFFYHAGFVTDAFRQSIAKNIRTGKFKRGASTISMQLVKNIFLSREKTLARKLEEILLVYILENNRIASKERMFEIYLNIIELGPNIYGIGEASQFYFKKKPKDLTLAESLFIATIIPRPKGFMWRFDKNGMPKPFVEKMYQYLSNKMVYRNMLLPEDTIGLKVFVDIKGPARKYIINSDTTMNDTIFDREFNRIEEGDLID